MTLDDLYDETIALIHSVRLEVATIVDELVIPTWGTDRHGWPRTLYGHVMGAFSLLDRTAGLAAGTGGSQTKRMAQFASEWLRYDPTLSEVAVHLWRHSLMHTGEPQRLLDTAQGVTWRWLLHWASHLPRDQHMTESRHDDDRILNFGLLYFVDDLGFGVKRWFDSIRATPQEGRVLARRDALTRFRVRLTLTA